MSNSGWLLLAAAFMLGIRHGFDLDHLATIDSMTRTVCRNRMFSRIVGFLFSLGHGLVVMCMSLLIGSGIVHSHVPPWLEAFGNGISLFFLLLFGIINLWNIAPTSLDAKPLIGIKSFFASKIVHPQMGPTTIVMIGALFAVSFDTFSQVALFSLSAKILSGCFFSGLLGFLFMLGMMTADGLNGFLVSMLIQQANKASQFFSRITSVIIAMFSLIIGIETLVKMV